MASFTSYTISHNLGLALLTGGSARYRIYSAAGLAPGDIARVIATAGLSFWFGVAVATAMALATHSGALALGGWQIDSGWTHGLGIVALAGLAALVWGGGRAGGVRLLGWSLPLPGAGQAAAQAGVAVLDLIAACAALLILIPGASASMLPGFFLAYALAIVTALLTHVPGGLGVFEAVVMAVLPSVPRGELLAALIAYRLIYYWLPLLAAAAMLALHEGWRWRHPIQRTMTEIQAVLAEVTPALLAVLAFAGGLVLLVSGALPALPERLHALRAVLPLPFVEASQIAASLAGTGLLLLAPGLYRRLDGAFHLTRILLVAGIAFSLFKGFDYEEAIALSLILLLLQWTRGSFYRLTALTADLLTPGWLAAVALALGLSVWIGMLAYRHVDYDDQLWWSFHWHGDASRFLRASLAAAVVLVAAILSRLLSAARPAATADEIAPPSRALLASADRADAFLALTGDKRFLYGAEGAFLMYQVQGRSWIVLGDPIGPQAAWPDLVWRLRERAHRAQGRLLFHQISPAMIPFAVDLGLTLVKYGEEAHVDLPGFSLDAKAGKSLRHAERRAAREGATFEIVPASEVPALLPVLKQVSDAWLADKGGAEKAFSVGRFDPDYLSNFDCALVRAGGHVVAFANILATDGRQELSIDLMRHLPVMPYGTMDFLFVHLMLWGRAQGFQTFNLGLAPLSGLPDRRLAPIWARVGGFLYRHGHALYGFEGLRAYKAKFSPRWEPRYIAGPGGLELLRACIDLQRLIAGRSGSAAAPPSPRAHPAAVSDGAAVPNLC
jgi:phosphatidylglycerol lysyltransferase